MLSVEFIVLQANKQHVNVILTTTESVKQTNEDNKSGMRWRHRQLNAASRGSHFGAKSAQFSRVGDKECQAVPSLS